MSSLVNDFIINPVLRQARRLSEVSRTTLSGSGDEPSDPPTESNVVIDNDHSNNDPANSPPIACPESPNARPLTRPLSSSTQTTQVEQTMTSPMTPGADGTPRDHLGFPISPKRGKLIPEDDGMRELRTRIHAIHALDAPPAEKAKLMHELLLEGYNASKVTSLVVNSTEDVPSPSSQTREEPLAQGALDSLRFWNGQLGESTGPEKFILSESDLNPSYAPIRQTKSQSGLNTPSVHTDTLPADLMQPPLGCQHYERNIKLQCVTCNKWYPCRLCHDAVEDHRLPRFDTKHMLCMLCGTPQKASEVCVACGEISAQYYCGICKLWENRQSKPIYHCYDCGICRRGFGLGKDYVHCKVRHQGKARTGLQLTPM